MIAQDSRGIPIEVGDMVCYTVQKFGKNHPELETGEVVKMKELEPAFDIPRTKLILDCGTEVVSLNVLLITAQLESNKENYPEYFI